MMITPAMICFLSSRLKIFATRSFGAHGAPLSKTFEHPGNQSKIAAPVDTSTHQSETRVQSVSERSKGATFLFALRMPRDQKFDDELWVGGMLKHAFVAAGSDLFTGTKAESSPDEIFRTFVNGS